MNVTPTREQVALEAAKYSAAEFRSMSSWFTHESELAERWLNQAEFRCAVDYAISKVVEQIRWNKHMSGYAAQHGGGARGVARVVGMVIGEWAQGGSSIDEELARW